MSHLAAAGCLLPLALAVLVASCSRQNPAPQKDKRQFLLTELASIEPWRADGIYPRGAWSKSIEVAKEFQAADPELVAAVLEEFVRSTAWVLSGPPGHDYEEDSKPFLLFRLMFELPQTNIPSSRSRFFKGWRPVALSTNDPPAQTWPVFWTNGQPYLAASWQGSSGRDYAVAEEYRFFLRSFPFRNLGKPVKP